MAKKFMLLKNIEEYIDLRIAESNSAIDQDVLNVVCSDHWTKLPLKWNKTNDFFAWPSSQPYTDEEVRLAGESVGIVHYTGSCKPWHCSCAHPARKLYWDYIEGTPWKGASYQGKGTASVVIRLVPFSMRNVLIRMLSALKRSQERVALWIAPVRKSVVKR